MSIATSRLFDESLTTTADSCSCCELDVGFTVMDISEFMVSERFLVQDIEGSCFVTTPVKSNKTALSSLFFLYLILWRSNVPTAFDNVLLERELFRFYLL